MAQDGRVTAPFVHASARHAQVAATNSIAVLWIVADGALEPLQTGTPAGVAGLGRTDNIDRSEQEPAGQACPLACPAGHSAQEGANLSKNASVSASFSDIPHASVIFPSVIWKTFTNR